MNELITKESTNLQTHIFAHQTIISRMATNSSSCKGWCITIVSAILVLGIDKEKPIALFVAILPIIVFWILDAYYLDLERKFREKYNGFISSLKKNETDTVEKNFFVFIDTKPNETHPILAKATILFYSVQLCAICVLLVFFFLIQTKTPKDIKINCQNINSNLNCVVENFSN